MTRITAFIIATNDVDCTAAGPSEDGKYAGWISRMENDKYRPLLNTEPIYDSEAEAVQAMEEIVTAVCEWVEEETKGKHPIEHVLDQVNPNSNE